MTGYAQPSTAGADTDGRWLEIATAAERCFERWGVQRTRMEDIAAEAGLARTVLYRYFESRQELQLAVMVRHIDRRAAELHAALPPRGPAHPLVLRALLAGIAEPPGDHVSKSVLGIDVVHQTAKLVAESDEIAAAMSSYWEPYLVHARERGELRDGVTVEGAVQWLTQIVFSSLALPELAPTGQDLEHQLSTYVVPAVIRS